MSLLVYLQELSEGFLTGIWVDPKIWVTVKLDSRTDDSGPSCTDVTSSSVNIYVPRILELHKTICSRDVQEEVASSAEGLITLPTSP